MKQRNANSKLLIQRSLRNAIATQLPEPIKVLRTTKELQELYTLWQKTYRTIYPDFKLSHRDPYNQQAYILYTRNAKGKVNSSARLVIDSPVLGLPEDKYFPLEVNKYRKYNYKLIEFGRFIIQDGNPTLLKMYYKSIFHIAKIEKVDIILMAMKQKDVAFHRNLIGAELLSRDIRLPHGGKDKLSCVAWKIKKTKSRFFRWTGLAPEYYQQHNEH